jgi:ATP-binding cassette subfamily B protein
LASAERIFQLLDTANELLTKAEPTGLTEAMGKIEFNGVTFGYEEDRPVLKRLTFRAEPGETIAIVGATGAGKTTIINLLERFYDPDRGEILLDGIDLKELDHHQLREQIGLVMQDVYIFPTTFKENIVLDKTVPEECLHEIIKATQLSRFVAALPEGLATRIGEGGQDLSAGQRQLLAMARVLIRDPRILVLDEATSSIDTETEIMIEKALAATMANRTSIIIAHRLSTIRRADRIIVMEQGRIVEEGDHESLMAARGTFHRLQTLQNGLLYNRNLNP